VNYVIAGAAEIIALALVFAGGVWWGRRT